MNMRARVKKLEAAAVRDLWDLTLLTDGELDALLKCYSEAEEKGEPVRLTPEAAAALERVARW